jgi:hypothetical protein
LKNAQYLLKDMVVTDAIEERSHDGDALLESCDVYVLGSRECDEILNAGVAGLYVRFAHARE